MSEKGKSHKAYPPEFKSECVRELLDGGETLLQVASHNGIAPSVLPNWKAQAPENMDAVFGAEAKRRREAEAERARQEEVDNPSRIIGQLTVERKTGPGPSRNAEIGRGRADRAICSALP